MLRKSGLALGGSLENAVVIGETGVLNNKLRFADEFVRHKILDAVGDLALLAHPLARSPGGHEGRPRAARGGGPEAPRDPDRLGARAAPASPALEEAAPTPSPGSSPPRPEPRLLRLGDHGRAHPDLERRASPGRSTAPAPRAATRPEASRVSSVTRSGRRAPRLEGRGVGVRRRAAAGGRDAARSRAASSPRLRMRNSFRSVLPGEHPAEVEALRLDADRAAPGPPSAATVGGAARKARATRPVRRLTAVPRWRDRAPSSSARSAAACRRRASRSRR